MAANKYVLVNLTNLTSWSRWDEKWIYHARGCSSWYSFLVLFIHLLMAMKHQPYGYDLNVSRSATFKLSPAEICIDVGRPHSQLHQNLWSGCAQPPCQAVSTDLKPAQLLISPCLNLCLPEVMAIPFLSRPAPSWLSQTDLVDPSLLFICKHIAAYHVVNIWTVIWQKKTHVTGEYRTWQQ